MQQWRKNKPWKCNDGEKVVQAMGSAQAKAWGRHAFLDSIGHVREPTWQGQKKAVTEERVNTNLWKSAHFLCYQLK